MTTLEKLEYARLRAQGASLFEKDETEANKWGEAVKELEAQLKKETES